MTTPQPTPSPRPDPTPVLWYSPLPPQPGGVSLYCHALLQRRPPLPVTLVTRIPSTDTPADLADLPRLSPSDAPVVPGCAALPIYQMCNNLEQAADTFDALRRHPGVTTVHDINIHGFLLDHLFRSRHRNFRLFPRRREEIESDPYFLALREAHGEAGERVAREVLNAGALPDIPSYPCHRLLTRSSRALIAHSYWAVRELAANDDSCRLYHLPLGIEQPVAGSDEGARRARASIGVRPDQVLLVSAGFLEPNRRVDAVIRALADLHRRGLDVQYVMAGAMDSAHANWLRDTAADLGIAKLVHFAGFLPDQDDFMNWLRAADIVVHLRHPTNGENSATVLRALAVGRPAIVTASDSYVELPDDCVWKVDHGPLEVPLLAEYVWELSRRTEIRNAMGQNGRELIRTRHHWDVVAAQYWEIVAEEAARLAPSAALQPDQVNHHAEAPRVR